MKPSRLKIMKKVFIFFMVWLVVILFGCQESVVKLKKIKVFVFFLTMKSSMIKIMEKVLIFFTIRLVVILFGCQESVGKLRILFPFFFPPVPTQYSSVQFFFYIYKKT